eukprot:CAMPEP_0198206150 /NCGR_PEP_ID=MMETSP1445-20131203/9683_1 /TAXON_ID=36898 /ORGANISM="Pyramimonas sp., Strain CCMP2087" /LENGTH=51 /DNA_ID=CAMNT_0043878723 /DNA_START=495 /DNA_END=650 /DNA_ORIENTATION=+
MCERDSLWDDGVRDQQPQRETEERHPEAMQNLLVSVRHLTSASSFDPVESP